MAFCHFWGYKKIRSVNRKDDEKPGYPDRIELSKKWLVVMGLFLTQLFKQPMPRIPTHIPPIHLPAYFTPMHCSEHYSVRSIKCVGII